MTGRGGPNAAMLFAAGFGTRMGALTADRPKPLIEVAGLPLLDHALGIALDAVPERIVVNTHYRAEQIEAHLQGRALPSVRVARETGEILDTGGGLKAALPLLRADPVWTLNTDAVWTGPNPLRTLAKGWREAGFGALVLLVPPDRAHGRIGRGDFTMDADGRLTRGPDLIYTGAQIIGTGPVAAHPARVFSMNAIWDALIAEGRLWGALHPGHWCDVGMPEGIGLAETMLREGAA